MSNIITKAWWKVFSFTAERTVKIYIQKDRKHTYKDLQLIIYKDVFHPAFFRSTKVFASWLEKRSLENKKVLELGCGSGLLSLIAAKHKAIVTAIDINEKAVENVKTNSKNNHLFITALHSDIFDALPEEESFDLVLINPPFYPKAPKTDYEHAWYCGENFDYFKKLFSQLTKRKKNEKYYMILSDTCNIATIQSIAEGYSIQFIEEHKKKVANELLTIYELSS